MTDYLRNDDARSREESFLPSGWGWSTLGEVAPVNVRDAQIRELPDSFAVSFVPMAAVDADNGRIEAPEERTLGGVRKGYTSFSENDVIFAKITPCMENGKAAIARGLTNGRGFGSTEFHVLKPGTVVLPEWIFYFVRQESFRQDAKANFTGTAGQLRVPASFLENHPIPLPPLAEQRRIVAAIEQQLTRLDAGVAALKAAQARLQRYKAAVLKAACEGRLASQDPADEPANALLRRILDERRAKWEAEQEAKLRAQGRMLLDDGWRAKYQEPQAPDTTGLPELPQGWVWASLPQLGELGRGKSKHRPRDDAQLFGGPYPFIQTGDVRRAEGVLKSYTETYSEFGLAQSRLWPVGTLCITIAANIAETAILGISACFPDSVVGFITQSGSSDIRFVEYFIRTAKQDLELYAPATAQKNINLDTLQNLAIPLPPLAEQQRIVAEVERRLSVVAEVEAAVAANLKRTERLRQAILKRAFEGKLVPQDPSDEPASALLERIRAEREQPAANQTAKRGRKRKDEQLRMEGM